MPASHRTIDAVIFDFGGVLSEGGRPSDLGKRFADHDQAVALRLLMGDDSVDSDHPWHRLERGEITLEENRRLNRIAFAEAGIVVAPRPDGETARMPMSFTANRPVVDLVHDLRAHGIRLGVLTNNVREFREMWWTMLDFDELFDDIVDSHEVGLRKPNPAIYELALARLGVPAERAAFLDDVPANVRGAEQVGMIGVLVPPDPTPAVRTVRALTGLETSG